MTRTRAPSGIVPSDADERLAVIDALRGAALFGVLVTNLLWQFRVTPYDAQLTPAARVPVIWSLPGLDEGVDQLASALVEHKAMSIFAMLFGAGIVMQEERARRAGARFGPRLVRRMLFLFALGALHHLLLFEGDILTTYAILGLVAWPLRRLRATLLSVLAALLLLVPLLPVPFPPPFSDRAAVETFALGQQDAILARSFGDLVRWRASNVGVFAKIDLANAPRTLALFALGMAGYRAGLFHERRRALRIVAIVGTVLGVAGLLLSRASNHFGVLQRLGLVPHTALACGYAACFVQLWTWTPARRWLARLAPVGRMALTNYVAQSVMAGAIFFGWGLRAFGSLGETYALTMAVAIYAAQAIGSTRWLERARFGPLEWLWRSFTYAKIQPWRRGPSLHVAAKSSGR